MTTAVDTFEQHRAHLTALAYRITGSITEAEDIVQDTYFKWSNAESAMIHNPKAWLSTVVSRKSLDHLKSAKVTREQYIGQWLPEPVDECPPPDVDAVSMAMLVLLEKLTPEERIAYVLRELFLYAYQDISDILQKSTAACRQLIRRARIKIPSGQTKYSVSAQQNEAACQAFYNSIQNGDLPALLSLLNVAVTLQADGGGKVSAIPHKLEGHHVVATFLMNVLERKLANTAGAQATALFTNLNGSTAMFVLEQEQLTTVFTFCFDNEQICEIYAQRNPEKLQHVKHL